MQGRDNVKGVSQNIYFLSYGLEIFSENDGVSRSKYNEHEASMMVGLANYI